MEAKINIAEILKDKPKGTKLYDLLRNIDVELDKVHITDVGSYIVCTATNESRHHFIEDAEKYKHEVVDCGDNVLMFITEVLQPNSSCTNK